MRRLFPLLGALALAGCSTTPDAPPAPAAGEDMAWILAREGREEPALFYGVPESDHILLMMACRPGSGAVEVTVFGAGGRPADTLRLASGEVRMKVAARSEPSLLHDEAVAATIPADAAVLTRFAETGILAVGVRESPQPFPTAPVAPVRRFIGACSA